MKNCVLMVAAISIGAAAPVSPGGAGGAVLWQDRFDSGPFDGVFRDTVVASGGHVYLGASVSGISGAPTDFADFVVRAHRVQDGAVAWEDRFDLAARDDEALAVATGAGRVFVAGRATTAGRVSVPVVRVYDGGTGALVWQDVGERQGLYGKIAVDGDRVFAIGVIGERTVPRPGVGFLFEGDWYVRAYEAHSGRVLWEDRFGVVDPLGSVQLDRAISVAAGGGRVYVGGRGRTSATAPVRSWFVRAHDAGTGHLLWQDQVSPAFASAQAAALSLHGDRLVAVGGLNTSASPRNQDWLVRAYDAATGTILWQDIADKGISPLEVPAALAVAGHRVIVAGIGGATCNFATAAPDNCDAIVRGYDLEDGSLAWEDRVDRGPVDEFASIDLRGDLLVATGEGGVNCDFSGLPTNCDVIVRAYDANRGQLRWEDAIDTSGTDDVGQGVVLHGGRAFVAAILADADFASDILLRAYKVTGGGREGAEP
jgi:outer membrane protein assembly factor BamB